MRPAGSAYAWRGAITVDSEIRFLVSWPPGPQFDSAWMLESARAAIGQIKRVPERYRAL